MDILKSVIISFCMIAMAAVIFEHFVPGDSFQRNIKHILALVLIIAVLTPFIGEGLSLRIPELDEITDIPEFNSLDTEVNSAFSERVGKNLETELLNILNTGGYDIKKVVIQAEDSEYNSIEIKSAALYVTQEILDDSDVQEEIIKLVNKNLGETEVFFERYENEEDY